MRKLRSNTDKIFNYSITTRPTSCDLWTA